MTTTNQGTGTYAPVNKHGVRFADLLQGRQVAVTSKSLTAELGHDEPVFGVLLMGRPFDQTEAFPKKELTVRRRKVMNNRKVDVLLHIDGEEFCRGTVKAKHVCEVGDFLEIRMPVPSASPDRPGDFQDGDSEKQAKSTPDVSQ